MVDLNKKIPGCKNFYWYEVLYLDSIGAHVYIDKEETKNNLIAVCKILQKIRDIYGKPIKITSGYRPKKYNKEIVGGASRSQHVLGKAIDFRIKGQNCDKVRKVLEPKLKELGIRMEDKPRSNWVHIDTRDVKYKRFFRP